MHLWIMICLVGRVDLNPVEGLALEIIETTLLEGKLFIMQLLLVYTSCFELGQEEILHGGLFLPFSLDTKFENLLRQDLHVLELVLATDSLQLLLPKHFYLLYFF